MIKYQARARFHLTTLVRTTLWAIALCFTIALPSTGIAQSFVNLKADPVYGGIGFVRGHWATSINKMLVFLVPGKETSVRAFDPVTNSWEFLWPSGTLGIQGRDNFASFYNPKLDELWVWNGSYLWNNPSALLSGRFHVSQRRWVATGRTDTDAFVGVVDMSATGGIMPFSGTDPAMAWAANSDMGLMLGGSSETGEFTFLFEAKAGGPEPYKVSRLRIPRPPWRAQCMNCMVSDGKDFYLFGGMYQEPNDPTRRNRKDLWKFDTSTRTWTQLPPPPDVAYAPMLTYDSDRHALVSWVRDRLYVYNIATQQWNDQTPAGLPCLFNQLGAYSPTAKLHIYEGGNDCTSPAGDAAFYRVVGIDLAGKFQPVPPPPNPPSPPPASSTTSPQSTSTSTSSGTFTVIPTPPPSTKFASGDRVQVSSGPVNVRSTASTSGASVGTQIANTQGAVIGGPANANGYDWWNINFDTGADGWVAENFLVKSNLPTPGPQASAGAASLNGCEAEGGLAGRTDILKCEPWESSVWYKNGWYRDQGDTGYALDGRRFYRYPADAAAVAETAIVTDGCLVGSCLKVTLRDWTQKIGSSLAMSWIIPGEGGCAHSTVGCVPQQEVYLRYYLRLAPNFDPENYAFADGSAQGGGGKWPGLGDALNGWSGNPAAIQCGNGGEGPTNGTECWSARLNFATGGITDNGAHEVMQEAGNYNAKTRFGLYPYLYNNGVTGGTRFTSMFADSDYRGPNNNGACNTTFGFSCGLHEPGILNNKWYLIEQRIKMNTPGTANGVMELWLDGQLRYSKTNVMFRLPGHNNVGVRQAWFDIYAGGVGVGYKENTWLMIDQMVVSTSARPGPWAAGSGVTLPPHPSVVVTPPPPSTISIPQPSTTITARNLGVTGEDKVGRINQTTPNGTADFHIAVAGLRGTPTRVRITSDTGGIWETPFNGQNWIIASQYDGQGNGHYWFEPFTSNNFRVQVWYPDGTTAAADAVKQTAGGSGLPADTVLPQVTITAPAANARVSKATTVAISATDNVGIAKIELYKDGSLIATGTSGAFQFNWDTAQESNGFHTLIAVAFDAANNRSTATLTVNVQNTASVGTKPSVLGQRF